VFIKLYLLVDAITFILAIPFSCMLLNHFLFSVVQMARLRKSRSSRGLSISYNTRSTAGKGHQTNKVVKPKAPSTTCQSAKKRRFRPGSKALQEIRHYQRG